MDTLLRFFFFASFRLLFLPPSLHLERIFSTAGATRCAAQLPRGPAFLARQINIDTFHHHQVLSVIPYLTFVGARLRGPTFTIYSSAFFSPTGTFLFCKNGQQEQESRREINQSKGGAAGAAPPRSVGLALLPHLVELHVDGVLEGPPLWELTRGAAAARPRAQGRLHARQLVVDGVALQRPELGL